MRDFVCVNIFMYTHTYGIFSVQPNFIDDSIIVRNELLLQWKVIEELAFDRSA